MCASLHGHYTNNLKKLKAGKKENRKSRGKAMHVCCMLYEGIKRETKNCYMRNSIACDFIRIMTAFLCFHFWFFLLFFSFIMKVMLTFSGNHGVTNGIWNVLLYECKVSKESGDTAPSIEKTPRENWLQTEMRKRIILFQLLIFLDILGRLGFCYWLICMIEVRKTSLG